MTKILIAALGAELGGAVRHLQAFLPELGRADPVRRYVVLVRDGFPEVTTAENVCIERIPKGAASNWLKRLSHDSIQLPLKLKREGFSALVSLLNTGPLWSPVPHILFQRNSLYFCKYYLESVTGVRAVETFLRRRLAMANMRTAQMIVTPSVAMKKMIESTCPPLKTHRIEVLPHGFHVAGFGDALDTRLAGLVASARGAKLLYPTHPAPHKCFPLLFEALSHLRQSGVEATLFATVDPADWPVEIAAYEKRIAELDLGSNVIFLGRVPQSQMGALYSAADLMVYPSLCESFGFSMIEAMGHGLPIVAARTDVNEEMCGDAALYYPPLDAVAASRAIADALLPETLESLRENASRRVAGYDWSWSRYARDFVRLIDGVC